jgi:ABC-type lipoprotein release transport system permease subunit
VLSVVGIALGCGVSLLMVSFVRGEGEMMMRAAAESGTGHLRVVPRDWTRTRKKDLRLPGWEGILANLRGMEKLEVVAPRARTEALLAFGTRTTGVEMVGVDPAAEPALNRLVREVVDGRYLETGDEGTVVVGKAIARRLDVEVEDDLMVTVSGRGGQMQSAMLRIVGLVSTGSRELDAGICHVNLAEVEKITGYPGAAEITALARDADQLPSIVREVQNRVPRGATVVTWKDILPELASGVEVDETWTSLMVGLVVVMVFLGIASAQLTAVLERRREFAVLAALGMHGYQLVHVMVMEGVVLGVLGGVAALALGLPGAYLMAQYGIDFSGLYGEADLAVSNILLDPVIYADYGWWLVPLALCLALGSTVLSSLYPAWYALRTDPAAALRVEK